MNLTAAVVDATSQRTDCLVLPVLSGRKLDATGQAVDAAWNRCLSNLLKRGEVTGKPGETMILHCGADAPAERIVLVGCGAARGISERDFRRAAAALAGRLASLRCRDAVLHLTGITVGDRDTAWKAATLGSALLDAGYRFDAMKSEPADAASGPRRVTMAVSDGRALRGVKSALAEAAALGAGKALARDLGNLPGNVCTPTYLASEARKLAQGQERLRTRVLTEKDLERLGMGSFLAVARGSAEPPRLIVVEYAGGDPDRRPVVLVGKGVTFDSGGISLKPGASMDEMKFDMCGAASVLGTLKALNDMAARVNVVGVIAATENLPSGTALKPGDIVKTMAGKTVEILNTDAEGRLILCDALTYASRFEPDVVIDIATLTGACMVALGNVTSGLFANDDALAEALLRAGTDSGDHVWRMPVWEDYQEQLSSNFADFANIGGRWGGAITAACFLERFVRDQRWAHLDIAGTAWNTGPAKGATGRPVPLLTRFVLDHGQGRKRSKGRTSRR